MDKLGVGWNVLGAQPAARALLDQRLRPGRPVPRARRPRPQLHRLAGVLAMTGPRGGAPQMPGVQIADLAGGALWARSACSARSSGAAPPARARTSTSR
jgi:hypothetical protein